MAFVVKDRVQEITTTTGTGTLTLGGALLGFQTFAIIGDGNTTYYAIADPITGDWEVGIGTYTASGTTLSRTTVLESSNSGSLVNFAAGSKNVFCTYPAERAVYLDTAGSAVTVLDIGTLGASTANITTANITSGTVSTTPTNNTDIVNKQYADAIASGIHFHEAVGYATTAALPACTYNNGTSGVGATLTGDSNGALTVDSYTFTSPADNGTRVLIKNQANQAHNGVYTLSQAGNSSPGAPFILTRATDFDTVGTGVDQIDEGDFFLVTSGTANANTAWVQQTAPPITIGTTAIVFQQFAAPITYTAGTGLSESPTYTFNIANTGTAGTYGGAASVPVFTTNAQGQVTSVTPTGIAIASGAVSGLAASATTDTTDASNITSGTLGTSRLSGSYTGVTGVGTLTAGTWNATAIGAVYGGTGLTSYAVGDLLYADTTTSLAKLADVAVGNALISGGVSAAPSYGKIGLATHVSGTLPTANGGTNLTGFTANGVVYASSTTALTTGTDLTFDGTALNLGGTGKRITGDFSNATVANRVAFQTSTTNSGTFVYALPNGTSTSAGYTANNNSSDPANASEMFIGVSGTSVSVNSNIRGTGTYLPTTFATGGSERVRIDTSGNVGIGTNSPTNRLTINSVSGTSPSFLLQGQDNTERLHITSAGASGGTSVFGAFSSRGTTASPTATQSGDALGYYQLGGYDGSAFNRSAWIQGLAAENYSATNRGSILVFSTTPNASTTIAERMRITSAGDVGIGTNSPSAQLHVKNAGGNSISILGQYGSGTIAQIGAYANQMDIKAYNGTNDVMTFTTGTSERMRIDSNGYITMPGSVSVSPRFSVGVGSGAAALTVNDGYGNANVAFNHTAGVPDVSGSSGRISCGVDSSSATMTFQLGNSTTAGVAVALTTVASLSTTGLTVTGTTTSTSFTGPLTGNASTATALSSGQSNWSGTGVIGNVVGMLAWKNYGNSHVIFDASNSTSPSGTAVNNTNSQVPWTGTYPTLMGWNGGNTYGVRVDSARVADSATTATNLSTASGSAPSYSARAWAVFNNGGGINASGNVSSVSKPGTGQYVINFSTAMPDANYAVSSGIGNDVTLNVQGGARVGACATGSFGLGTTNANGGLFADFARNSVMVMR